MINNENGDCMRIVENALRRWSIKSHVIRFSLKHRRF